MLEQCKNQIFMHIWLAQGGAASSNSERTSTTFAESMNSKCSCSPRRAPTSRQSNRFNFVVVKIKLQNFKKIYQDQAFLTSNFGHKHLRFTTPRILKFFIRRIGRGVFMQYCMCVCVICINTERVVLGPKGLKFEPTSVWMRIHKTTTTQQNRACENKYADARVIEPKSRTET